MPVHAQLPCDQSKFSKRPYQPVDTKLPISGRTITASEIVERVSFK